MDLGAPELVVLLIVVTLLFGAKKLPELARGTGQALRIFKEETRAAAEPAPVPVRDDEEPGRPA